MKTGGLIFIVCLFGALKEFRPSEPFLSPFLNGPKNFTELQINHEIYPIGTYSYMSMLIFIFLLTDYLRYKPILILQGLSGVVTYSMLLWTETIPMMQISQVFYGLFCASDVAYSAYLYSKIDKKFYQKATAMSKATVLFTKFCSGLTSQILTMFHVVNYSQLNYITLAVLSSSTIVACFLPPATHSLLFNKTIKENPQNEKLLIGQKNTLPVNETKDIVMEGLATGSVEAQKSEEMTHTYSLKAIFYLWLSAIRNPHTLKWSLWLAFSLCGYLQVTYYVQLLWQAVINSGKADGKLYHGFSNSFNSLAGALCTFGVGYVRADWSRYGEITLAAAAAGQGALLIYSSLCEISLISHYILYALFKIMYQVSSTIASSEVAKSLVSESYGLVFGVNTFIALVGQSILTVIVTKALELDINSQFLLYGMFFEVLGAGFALAGLLTIYRMKKNKNKNGTN